MRSFRGVWTLETLETPETPETPENMCAKPSSPRFVEVNIKAFEKASSPGLVIIGRSEAVQGLRKGLESGVCDGRKIGGGVAGIGMKGLERFFVERRDVKGFFKGGAGFTDLLKARQEEAAKLVV